MAQNITSGFFQELFEGRADNTKPVLQLLELRPYNQMQSSIAFRARMSDSIFNYTSCIGTKDILESLESKGVTNTKPIIKVNGFTKNFNNGKLLFCLTNISILEESSPMIGQPIPHSGNPQDYRGMSYHVKPEASSPSRKRSNNIDNSTTPSKRSNNDPTGGVFGKRVFSIKDISPYINQFLLCGIVTTKDPVRDVNTRRGMSKIFNFTFADEEGNSIRIGAWGDQAEKYNNLLNEGEPYYINIQGGGTVREANKQFNSTGHPYELSLNSTCDIEPCSDRKIEAAPLKFNVIPLNEVKLHAQGFIDVLAVIDKVDDIATVNSSKTGATLFRRNVSLVDDSNAIVQLTLWGDDAKDFNYNPGEVIGLKAASVREFNGGFSLGVQKASNQIFINPGGPDACEPLQKWYIQERPNAEIQSMSAGESGGSLERDFRLIGVVTGSGMAHQADDKGMYINVKGLINAVRPENAFYQSCKSCRKKVTVIDNQINCDRCGVQDEAKFVYMLSIEIADFSGVVWGNMFDEAAKQLLGISADELQQISLDDREQYDAIFDRIRFKEYFFRCRVKYEIYNDKQNLRWTIMQANPINYDRLTSFGKATIDKADSIY